MLRQTKNWKNSCHTENENRIVFYSMRKEAVKGMKMYRACIFGARKKGSISSILLWSACFSTLEQRIRKFSSFGVDCKLCHMLKLLLLNFMCQKTIIEVWHNLQTTPKSFSEQKVPHRCEDKLLLLLLPSKHSKLPKETRSE